jgi:hypothetical protein
LAIDRVRAVGGGFYSVEEGLDVNTDAGRLVLHILLSTPEYNLASTRAGWEEARARVIRRGAHTGHPTPVGYRRTRAGRLTPDAQTAPVITEVYRRRAAGETLGLLCRYLADRGVRTGKGNPGWSTGTLSKMLKSPVYLGEVHSGTYVRADATSPSPTPPPGRSHSSQGAHPKARTLRASPRFGARQVRDLRRSLDELDAVERRELISNVIDMVFIAAGHGSPEQRVTVCPAGTARFGTGEGPTSRATTT